MNNNLFTGYYDALVAFLKSLFDPLHALLNQLPPSMWRISICAYILIGTLWVLFLSRDFIMKGSPDNARWRDLRLWIPLLLLPYLLVYLIF
jgi:hypothetical protein